MVSVRNKLAKCKFALNGYKVQIFNLENKVSIILISKNCSKASKFTECY